MSKLCSQLQVSEMVSWRRREDAAPVTDRHGTVDGAEDDCGRSLSVLMELPTLQDPLALMKRQ
ncbi:hypothetical protein J6590_032194 [Homalodisca vitripennis]|nr:hypothetical protein J6590_032194 [Homalodisca vitripennis]